MLDGTERLGVIGMSFEGDAVSERTVLVCERYAHLAAMLIATKTAYGDSFETTRRRRPMTIASELLWQLAPPLVFATERLVVAGMLEPCYDNGGDALGLRRQRRRSARRRLRRHGPRPRGGRGGRVRALGLPPQPRRGYGLLETYAAMDEAVGEQFPDERYVTAVIAQLDLEGRAPVVDQRRAPATAGHPRRAAVAHADRATGRAAGHPAATGRHRSWPKSRLEPGDLLLLYTDGLTEARHPDGQLFTVLGLGEFIEREAAAGQTAPETLRRLRHAIVDRAARASSRTTPPRCSSSGAAGPKPTCCHRRRPSPLASLVVEPCSLDGRRRHLREVHERGLVVAR